MWSLKKVAEKKLEASHHKWLRKILHIYCKDIISNNKFWEHKQQRKLEDAIHE